MNRVVFTFFLLSGLFLRVGSAQQVPTYYQAQLVKVDREQLPKSVQRLCLSLEQDVDDLLLSSCAEGLKWRLDKVELHFDGIALLHFSCGKVVEEMMLEMQETGAWQIFYRKTNAKSLKEKYRHTQGLSHEMILLADKSKTEASDTGEKKGSPVNTDSAARLLLLNDGVGE